MKFEKMLCAHCNETATLECNKCKTTFYCSSKCGIENWNNFHKYECIGMKRGRDDISDEDIITLKSKEGQIFKIMVKHAKLSQTIMNFIDDNGIENVIEFRDIDSFALNSIIEYMIDKKSLKKLETYSRFISIILAANYLDVSGALEILFRIYHEKKFIEQEKYANDGFTAEERQFVNSRHAHSKDIHNEPISNAQNLSLLNVPKDVIEKYYLRQFYNIVGYGSFDKLLIFRARHAYFWHLTNNFIIRTFKEQNQKEDLASLSNEQIYDIAEYQARKNFHSIVLGDYAVKGKEFPNFKDLTFTGKLILAIKKHGSIAQMELAVQKLQASKDRAKQKSKDTQENIINNFKNVKEYVNSLGYKMFLEFGPVKFYRIVNFKNDVNVKNYIENLDREINLQLLLKPLNFEKLQNMVTFEKLKVLLQNMDPDLEMRNDAYFFRVIQYLKENGHSLSKSEVLKYGNLHMKLILQDLNSKKQVKEELRRRGYDIPDYMIIQYDYNIEKIIDFVKSSSLEKIREFTINWQEFLLKIKDL